MKLPGVCLVLLPLFSGYFCEKICYEKDNCKEAQIGFKDIPWRRRAPRAAKDPRVSIIEGDLPGNYYHKGKVYKKDKDTFYYNYKPSYKEEEKESYPTYKPYKPQYKSEEKESYPTYKPYKPQYKSEEEEEEVHSYGYKPSVYGKDPYKNQYPGYKDTNPYGSYLLEYDKKSPSNYQKPLYHKTYS